MKLFLTLEEMWDRPLGGEDRTHEIPHWCGNICYVIVGLVLKIAFRFKVHGRENLRSARGKQGLCLCSTHTSFLDVAFLYVAVRPSQWVRFMARDSLFTGSQLGAQIIARVGAFPVTRDSADRTSVKRATRMLRNKEVVGIFPEGTRRGKSENTPSLHAGAALVARMGKAPLVPTAVRNVEKIKRKGERVRFPRVHVLFGEPIDVKSFEFLPKEDRLEGAVWYVMRESFALQRDVPADQIDMVELFPETKDYSQVFAEHPIRG